jgi:predicted DNA-binding transcriptional regulator AlpA
MTIHELADILNRSPATIATQVSKSPEKLPPRLMLPGSRKVLWLKSDVEEWIESHRLNKKVTRVVDHGM